MSIWSRWNKIYLGSDSMRLKDGLILREVAGQFIIVPTGKRVQEITNMVYISSSAAYLWEYMEKNEFTKDVLVKRIMEHYIGVTEEVASADIEKFLATLKRNNILEPEPGEPEVMGGYVRIRIKDVPKDMLEE